MKIGLLSDTHAHLDPRIFDYLAPCQEIWHAGDFGSITVSDKLAAFRPLRAVYGNIDGAELRKTHPLHQRFTIEGVRVWMTHIGGYPGHYPVTIRQILQVQACDLFICGHSHILRVVRDPQHNNMLLMNPGAAGLEGFHKMRTMLRFDIENGKISNAEVIELGLRGALKENN